MTNNFHSDFPKGEQRFITKYNKIVQATKSSEATKKHKEVNSMMTYNSYEWAENIMLIVELRKKLLTFRDVIDLPPCDDSGAIEEVIILSAI